MVLHFRLDRNHFVIFRNVTLAGSQTGGNLIDEKCFISLLHASALHILEKVHANRGNSKNWQVIKVDVS
ncbi:hypothetical protein CFELI_03855 [Corynebacterium felinum]|uniref:Uncharacterized protein n=1 Tax=Corynebacterium felinum TaxID=131318 RepID=A0ABU2B8W0_9CORY|nr:hypothetical protein [Corynebacterium felinum]WJY94404.1 hypothetical protein CFELI_03855 [Corynebacterium felinum]